MPASKFREMAIARRMEKVYTKDEILELYLNLAPYGGNLEGVGAASRFYFGKDPAALSPGEIALLVFDLRHARAREIAERFAIDGNPLPADAEAGAAAQ